MTGVEGGELLAAFVSDGDLTLELIQFLAPSGGRGQSAAANDVGTPHLGFVCENVRAAHAAWNREGVHFFSEPLYSEKRDNWSVMMRDPDGIMIELLEHPALTAEQVDLARA